MVGWLIISSRQNFEITSQLRFRQQGLKHRHRKKAALIKPDDLLFIYLTGEQKLAATLKITSFCTEAKDRIWVNLGKNPNEVYPWRFTTQPQVILEESQWLPMEKFSKQLLHFRKWPEPYWRLGLQGQIHALRDEDTQVLAAAFSTCFE